MLPQEYITWDLQNMDQLKGSFGLGWEDCQQAVIDE